MHTHTPYMEMALSQAREALKRKEFPVGCVMEHQGVIVASGKRINSALDINEIDHAEIVALRNLYRLRKDIDMAEVTVYSTMEPCLMCFATLLINGIRRFVYSYEDSMGGGTNLELSMLSPLYSAMEPEITPGILRTRSLLLFKEFFANPENHYLKNSLLARYTLKQELPDEE